MALRKNTKEMDNNELEKHEVYKYDLSFADFVEYQLACAKRIFPEIKDDIKLRQFVIGVIEEAMRTDSSDECH